MRKIFRTEEMETRDLYQCLVASIVPRAIAWVSTISKDGVANIAPYSFFTGVTANPPSLLICPVNNRQGKKKDTLCNIEDNGEFVVNVVPQKLLEVMHETSVPFESNESEFDTCGIQQVKSEFVAPPGVADSPVRIECKKLEIFRVGSGALGGNIIVGNIVAFSCDPAFLGEDGWPDYTKILPVGRLGGIGYAMPGEIKSIERKH